MSNMNDELMDIIKYLELDTGKEHASLECKEAGSKIPSSLWTSYSAFANTEGGIIALGIKEENGGFFVSGVQDPFAMEKMFWDTIASRNKVNRNILRSEDVKIVKDVSGKYVIFIYVPEAADRMKPIFINSNTNLAYIRRGESDQKASEDELNAMLRNSSPDIDIQTLQYYSINDIDAVSLADFKSRVSARYPDKEYEKLSNEEFLQSIGFFRMDRRLGKLLPTQGCVLFLGKYNSIKEIFPSYYLDYQDCCNTDARWRDRISSDLPSAKEMNLFNFYNIVYDKLIASDNVGFQLDENQVRLDISLSTALREALVNTLAHADYDFSKGYIKIEVHDEWYSFYNPGKMLVSIDEYARGGVSRIRNEIVMSGFRLLGLAERQGMGGHEIIAVSEKNRLKYPEVKSNLSDTCLRIWKTDMAYYPEFNEDEQIIFRFMIDSMRPISTNEVQAQFPDLSKYKILAALHSLMDKDKIVKIGESVATKYMLNPTSKEMSYNIQRTLHKIFDFMK